jgi:hypothetical protein
VSFRETFDGFAVIHAAFLHPQRRKHFEAELRRVGIDRFEVIQTQPVSEIDPRLQGYAGPARGLLSLTDGFLAAIDHAESAGWDATVIMEDDIVFRKNFDRLWSEVEHEVRNTQWGILTLHRIAVDGRFLVDEPLLSRTKLIPIFHNTLTHCVIVRKESYPAFRASLLACIDRGYPCDFFYGIYSHLSPSHLYATNRNLTGQAGGLASSLNPGLVRPRNFYSTFRSGSYPECIVLNPLRAQLSKLKRAGSAG